MNHTTTTGRVSIAKVVLVAGLVAGTLDILAACIQFYINTGRGPSRVFQFIASGVFGKDAFGESKYMPAWGLFFHYLIALLFAWFFAWLYRSWPLIRRHIIVSGIGYGLFAWLVMNKVVLPLSKAPAMAFEWKKALMAMTILVLMIGLPIALITRRYDPR